MVILVASKPVVALYNSEGSKINPWITVSKMLAGMADGLKFALRDSGAINALLCDCEVSKSRLLGRWCRATNNRGAWHVPIAKSGGLDWLHHAHEQGTVQNGQ